MLELIINEVDVYNEATSTFAKLGPFKLHLEHSLVSISKWEAITKKSFLGTDKKTVGEIVAYIECMTINQISNKEVYNILSRENLKDVISYIDRQMTATVLPKIKQKKSGDVVTSELIYYWMISHSIPFECQKWHLNRLLTLIELCNRKNAPAKKMPTKEILTQNRAINEARKMKHKTSG